jgi:hypothetical protein
VVYLDDASTRRAWFLCGYLYAHFTHVSFIGVIILMKDSNDAQTIDWVDEAEQVCSDSEQNPTGFYITENAALDKALANIINITLQDLLAEYN